MPYLKLSASHQNLELYYELHGEGNIKILLIMGLLADGAAWFRQTEFFLKYSDYQCVTFDNRGFGRSSSPLTYHYSTTQMAKDTLALIDHLNWNRCHVVGISMGGMIALELALLSPEKILSLTLLATHAGGLAGRAPFIGIRHMTRAICLTDEALIVENTLLMLYGEKTLSDRNKRKSFENYHTERFRNRIKPTIIGLIGQLTALHRHYVSYGDLLKIRYSPFECLIIVGTEDRLVRETNSYLIRKVLSCRLVKLDDAGHGLHGECAEEVNQELLKLFESIRKNELSNKFQRKIPEEYATEIKALEQCCQHRSHCFFYDLVGFLKGIFFGLFIFIFFSIFDLKQIPLIGINLTFSNIILFGCLNGLYRSLKCVYHAFYARRFVQEHKLELNRAAHHGGIGVGLPEEPKNGVPQGCGFEFPIHSLIIIANLLSLIYWTKTI